MLINRSQKLQLRLTVEFALFFFILSGFIYLNTINTFEDEALEKYNYKAKVFSNYLEQNPEIFWNGGFQDKDQISKLVKLNDALYLVLEDRNGSILDAVNIDDAEKNLYILTKNQIGISSFDESYRVSLPIIANRLEVGRIYVGFDGSETIASLHKTKLLTALFALSIFSVGIVLTYYLSSISFKPITKLISSLDKVINGDKTTKIQYSKDNEIGVLVEKINSVLSELDKSSANVETLNKKLRDSFKEKIYELDSEINQRKKAEISLRMSEEQFGLVFENAPIGMVIISPDDKIISINKSFCQTTGFDKEELLGVPIALLFNDERKDKEIETNVDEKLYWEDLHTEKVMIKKNNDQVNVILKSVVIYDHSSKPKHVIVQVLDISKIKKTQEELILALESAETSNKLKSAFLAQMSHEIRTPLNVILTSVPILTDEIGDKDDDIKTVINSVGSAGRRLQRTIDMILNMSAVQSGNYKPDFEEINLSDELIKLVYEVKTMADEKGLKLSLETDVDDPFVIADKYTLTQIFQNLIGNSIKYTHKGFVKIIIKNLDEDHLKVDVADSGIGMKKGYLDKLFAPFSQEDVGHKRQYEGNGLGLALVKNYVELNNAEVTVESEKNKGSVFTVTFLREKKSSDPEKIRIRKFVSSN